METADTSVKLVIVGSSVGKTCLLITHTQGKFPGEYIPTVFDNYTAVTKFEGKRINLGLWDTAEGEDYHRLRPLSYPQTDVFIIAFSVVDPASFAIIPSYWLSEVRHFCPSVPIILAGLKSDLRDNPAELEKLSKKGLSPVTSMDAEMMARKYQFEDYIECSSLLGINLDQLFSTAIRAGLRWEALCQKRPPLKQFMPISSHPNQNYKSPYWDIYQDPGLVGRAMKELHELPDPGPPRWPDSKGDKAGGKGRSGGCQLQ